MLKDVPIKFLLRPGEYTLSLDDLNDFFGFLEVEVECPINVTKPMLPVKYKGKTIYPTGKWNGTYFSEEIKAVLALNLGYKFKIIKGYKFLLRPKR